MTPIRIVLEEQIKEKERVWKDRYASGHRRCCKERWSSERKQSASDAASRFIVNGWTSR